MTHVSVMPREVHEWSVDELDLVPPDGLQYELLDGLLLVTPAPSVIHQRAVGRIFLALAVACPAHYEAFVAPLDWRPDRRSSLQPDVLVIRKDHVGTNDITEPLTLAVEVLSPSTRRKDQVLKRSKYEDAGVESYWIIDPSEPAITAYDLIDGRYVEAGSTIGDHTLSLARPFPISVIPAQLV